MNGLFKHLPPFPSFVLSPKWLLGSLALSTCTLAVFTQPARSEGSRSLYPAGATGSRANLEWRTSDYFAGSTNPLKRRTLLKVYANAGEVIFLGSSAVGVDNGDIRVYNPGQVTGPVGQENVPNDPAFSCAAQRTTAGAPANQGQITSRTQELAGPDTVPGGSVTNGYVPCYYTAPTAGVYDVVFFGPAGGNSNAQQAPTGDINLSSANNFNANQSTSVAAWDVTVRSALNSPIDLNGRLFSFYSALFSGANNRPVNSTVFVVTTDGFRYRTELAGVDPNGFLLYGNRVGFLDSDGSTPLHRDVVAAADATNRDQLTQLQGDVRITRPEFPLFFNLPNDTAISAVRPPEPGIPGASQRLSIPLTATAPTVSNFSFTGSLTDNTSLVSAGGTFNYTANVEHTYEIVISRDGINFDPTAPQNRVLRGLKSGGAQSIIWNGNDNSGSPFPVGTYSTSINIRSGEYHFPLIDAENSRGGPRLTLINPPAEDATCSRLAFGCSTVFYDDRGYRTTSGTTVGTVNQTLPGTNPRNPNNAIPLGYNSANEDRPFGDNSQSGFGDKKGLDLWTFFPSNTIQTSLNIVALLNADLSITKTDNQTVVTAGSPITYEIVVTNNGPDNVTGVTVNDVIPADILDVTWTCTASDGSSCTASGEGNTINDTNVNLLNGGTATYTITGNVSTEATDTLSNTATVTPPTGVTDANTENNTATDTTTVNNPPVAEDLKAEPTANNVTTTVPTLTATDPDQDAIASFTIKTLPDPSQGTLRLNGQDVSVGQVLTPDQASQLTFTPNPNFTGDATFTYTATDSRGAESLNPATVTLPVTQAVNNPPNAEDKTASTPSNTTVQLPSLTATDPDKDAIASFTITTLPPTSQGVLFLGDPASGGVPITAGQVLTPDQISQLFFQPAPGVVEGVVTFNYTATDSKGAPDPTPATVAIAITGSNLPPVADNKTSPTTPNTSVVQVPPLTATDSDGTVVSYTITTLPPASQGVLFLGDPASGGVRITAGQVLTPDQVSQLFFQPNPSFSGNANFYYTAEDNQGAGSNTASVTIPVAGSNQPPVADSVTTPSVANNTTVQLPSLTATDPDGTVVSYTIATLPPASQGVLYLGNPASGGVPITVGQVLTPDQVSQLFFQPNPSFSGDATFTFTAKDNQGADSAPASVTIPVAGPPRLRLVKRITAVNRNGILLNGLNFNTVVDVAGDDDNATDWPQNFLTGLPKIEPDRPLQSGDEVEYTIYFLSDGGTPANNVRFCDPIPTGTTFLPNSFGGGRGILLRQDGVDAPQSNASDTDKGRFFSPLAPVTTPSCPDLNNPNGAVVLQLGNITNTVPNQVGFVRFRVKID